LPAGLILPIIGLKRTHSQGMVIDTASYTNP
jgi:hypothetical protein